ncbi:DsbA family protein [Bacillus cereus group sp. N21]|uniref:DsbA family oxidoreductase n=1 Tax=Bacillus cereus group sp. N21 TaxID=2794591 RepID=UPI0018F708A0|nr:DsbA family oxidoreductase [Bacillus cereus group sp. N21]MBJ8028479.1 DsbA family oxidoreductase [Bacillus cereus group sp. N21]
MTVKMKVYSDFICPFCFLAKGPLDEVAKEKDVEIEWMPFELRPSPYAKIDPWQEPDKLSSWDSFILPTAKKLGVEMSLPRVSPHPYTHFAFEGYQFAKEHGLENAFHHRVFTAFFQEEQNIEEIDVLTKLAGEVGLSEAEFKEALITHKYKEKHQKAIQHAYDEANIMAVPTVMIGDEVIQGLASKEMLERVIDKEIQKGKTNSFDGMQCTTDGYC